MIDNATKEKILDAVRIEEVIGDFVSLRKRGANYLGICPFHQDKNPSMSVSATKGIFKCFACGKAGNAVSFIMEHEHMSYPEALKYLAAKYHIEVKEKEETPEEIASRKAYESLQVVSEYAQKYYQDVLWNTDIGRAIGLSYFRERKFSDETIKKFGLGYAASRGQELHKDAIRKGYNKEYLLKAGLCVERDNGDLADRFFDRVMFPIYSLSGRVIAFGGRTLKSDKTVAKYVNSPETEIYVKSRSLYGIFQAKTAIQKADQCILVEGYADVISMHQSGIENVVASSGTSLTVEQIRLIKRFTTNILVIYDGDAAGIKAALRGIDLILEEGMNVRVVLLPPEDDPDSFAKAHSKIEIEEFIEENKKDFISFKTDILLREASSDPYARSNVIADITKSISMIPDAIVRGEYVNMVAEKFSQKPEALLSKIAELRRKKRRFDSQYQQFQQMRQPAAGQPAAGPQSAPPPDDLEPIFEGEPYPGDPYDEPALPKAISDSFLAVCEKELCYYLLKFGAYKLRFERDIDDEPVSPEDEISADQYIKSALADDDIEFTNPLYKNIYDQYFEFASSLAEEDPALKQQKVLQHFSFHEDQSIAATALDMMCNLHPITVEKYEKALVPEEMRLHVSVPKAVLLYKLRITEEACTATAKQIAAAQRGGDEAILREKVRQLQMLNKIKNAISKELKRPVN